MYIVLAASCQIPFFHNLRDVYSFVFGWKRDGVFVEIGAFDGETISNTCCLADIGWEGHYIEPVPQYAAQCKARHARNPKVSVHQYAVGKTADEGKTIELQVAGPFSSGDDEEIAAMNKMGPLLQFLAFFGWTASGETAKATIKPLNAVLEEDAGMSAVDGSDGEDDGKKGKKKAKSSSKGGARKRRGSRSNGELAGDATDAASSKADQKGDSKITTATMQLATAEDDEEEKDDSEFVKRALRSAGFATNDDADEGSSTVRFAMDVMVLDVEGMEWQVLKDFDLPKHRPRLAIVEIQEKLTRMQGDRRQLRDAARIEEYFYNHGYSILYRDVINTVFIHRAVRCHGEN